ncbi:MAG: zinc ribbon domain-containing protein [Streptococcaceae bacterium]|jgi:hypothetical protein|nr:zinc ribbon domain-containing protein [Streptococcaceae bacterium]
MEKVANCQSCFMPMDTNEKFGTNENGHACEDYCVYCFQSGAFTKEQNLEEAIIDNIPFWKGEGESDDVARERIMAVFPNLKRWNV